MTIDDLARSTQEEFTALRAKMANKDDVGRILQAIADLDHHVSATASSWREDFEQLAERVKKIEQHLHLEQ